MISTKKIRVLQVMAWILAAVGVGHFLFWSDMFLQQGTVEIYSLANPISLYRFEVNKDKCVSCGLCQKVCDMDIPVWQTPNSPECIRCGKCKRACPKGAIESTLDKLEKKIVRE